MSLLPVAHPDCSCQNGLVETQWTLSRINCVNFQQINFPQTKPGSLITILQLREESIKGALWVKCLLSHWQISFCGGSCATAVKEFATSLSYQPHSCCLLSSTASLWSPKGVWETLFIFNCLDRMRRLCSPPWLLQICKEADWSKSMSQTFFSPLSLFSALNFVVVLGFMWPEFKLLQRLN